MMTIGFRTTTIKVARMMVVIRPLKPLKVSWVPRAMKKTITKKSRNGRRREAISWAYGRVASETPPARAPTSSEKPALASRAAAAQSPADGE